MNVEFRKSFEKDLSKIRYETLLQRIQAVIEEVEKAESLGEVNNIEREEKLNVVIAFWLF